VIEFVAHRGIHDTCTENTLDSFQRALDLGFRAVELDVHVTADDVCVVHHDESVITSGAAIVIRSTRHDTLRSSAPHLPRLEEVLDLLAGRAHTYIELKGRDTASVVAGIIRKTAARETSVHSFDHEAVLRMRHMLPQLRTGILQASRLVDSASALRAAMATDLWQWHEFVDRTLIEQVSAVGGRVIAWTANTPSEWQAFEESGVAAICTDLPINSSAAFVQPSL
jgi:glycerophosphoryl diester phosphodiesterase